MEPLKPVEIGMNKLDFNRFPGGTPGEYLKNRAIKREGEKKKEHTGEDGSQYDEQPDNLYVDKSVKDSFVFHSKSSLVFTPFGGKLLEVDNFKPLIKKPVISTYFEYEPQYMSNLNNLFIFKLMWYLCEELHLKQSHSLTSIINYFYYLALCQLLLCHNLYFSPPKPLIVSEKYFAPSFGSPEEEIYKINLKPVMKLNGQIWKK
jgi:hypothetical protein